MKKIIFILVFAILINFVSAQSNIKILSVDYPENHQLLYMDEPIKIKVSYYNSGYETETFYTEAGVFGDWWLEKYYPKEDFVYKNPVNAKPILPNKEKIIERCRPEQLSTQRKQITLDSGEKAQVIFDIIVPNQTNDRFSENSQIFVNIHKECFKGALEKYLGTDVRIVRNTKNIVLISLIIFGMLVGILIFIYLKLKK